MYDEKLKKSFFCNFLKTGVPAGQFDFLTEQKRVGFP
jgi:hypothetical protein